MSTLFANNLMPSNDDFTTAPGMQSGNTSGLEISICRHAHVVILM